MSENKNEKSQEFLKQLGNYKTSKLAEISAALSLQKSRAAVLMTSVRAKREVFLAKAEEEARFAEEKALREDTEKNATQPECEHAAEIDINSAEQIKNAVPEHAQTVSPSEEIPAAEATSEQTEPVTREDKPALAEAVKPDSAEKTVKEVKPEKEETEAVKKEAEPAKPEPEILPNGEIRRIYIPPEPVKKPNVQTRVFQGGYNARGPRPQGGPSGGGAPRPQGGGYGGPRRDSMSASVANAAQQFPPKPAQQKGKGGKPGGNNQKFDDRNAMNKRALIKKGFIVDDKILLDDEDARVRAYKNRNKSGGGGGPIIIEHAIITTDPVPIKVLSEKIGKSAAEIIKTLFLLGIIKTINENIDFATAELVTGELSKNHPITLEYKPDVTFEDTLSAKQLISDEDEGKLVGRPPVVTIMGHVDHGKTSLLDHIRKTDVAGGEAGGITQHIGAYTVSLKGSPITFLDTPGHEAFTSMRARGAQVTDIAVLVVAADDGIMPQTIEAINHARQAQVPIIVAVNKMDKAGANPDRVLQQLTEHEVLPEEWGGDTPVVRVSAKTGEGVPELLENILIMAEVKELKANPDRAARGTIIEARLDKGIGKVATILVQTGTLRIGDNVVAGVCTGKIRAMIDDKGRSVKKAGPSTPVSVTGWDEVPEAGDIMDAVADEKFARELALERKLKTSGSGEDTGSVSLNDLFDKIRKGELKSVKLIIKADVQGSLEAVKQSLSKLGNDEVDIDIIHGGVGAIKESDVSLADTAKAIIIGFNVRPDVNAKALAAQKKIDIRFYDIIYNAIEDIEKAVKGLLEPKFKENVLGSAEVRELFKITGVGIVAGSHVTEGKIIRGAKARLIRNGSVETTTEINSLRHGKDDVKEMAKNFDCGIMLGYPDVKVGDVIEAFEMERIDED